MAARSSLVSMIRSGSGWIGALLEKKEDRRIWSRDRMRKQDNKLDKTLVNGQSRRESANLFAPLRRRRLLEHSDVVLKGNGALNTLSVDERCCSLFC
jgi:aminoglycoside phosphotransferase